MKSLIMMIVVLLSATFSARAQDVTGNWQGALKVGAAELHLVLHVTKAESGELKATLDSVDQGASGIPVNPITLKDSRLNFTVEAVHGSYQGSIDTAATEIDGTWTQGQSLPLIFKRATAAAGTAHNPAKPSEIDGAWMGAIDTGMVKLRVVFHITNTEDGLMATLDSPDQGAKGIPVSSVKRDGKSLKMEVKSIAGTFEGKITSDLTTIEGTWTQGGKPLPLVLKLVKDAAELLRKRPQNPVKPYPYREEEVSYANRAANFKLAATLTIPPGKGPFSAVLLITGSGPQDRDEALMGHRPFFVLADYLTRHGIAVLRADDRGVGKSGGSFDTATTADFATDAEAGVAYLKGRPEVDPHRIGLIGHSEGGMIASMVAARNPDVAFIVMMAGTGVPGDQIIVAQQRLILAAAGKSPAQVEKLAAAESEILTLVEHERDNATLEVEVRKRLAGKAPEAQVGAQIKMVTSPWFRYFITYNPANDLKKVRCPVLALNGEKDLQVPPKLNLLAIRKALEEGGNQHVEIDELSGLNHLFQTARTGAPSEYAEIEETISPVALEKISSWINHQ